MVKISLVDKAKFTTKGMAILKSLKANPKRQEKLIAALRANGFDDIADLAVDAQKYIEEV